MIHPKHKTTVTTKAQQCWYQKISERTATEIMGEMHACSGVKVTITATSQCRQIAAEDVVNGRWGVARTSVSLLFLFRLSTFELSACHMQHATWRLIVCQRQPKTIIILHNGAAVSARVDGFGENTVNSRQQLSFYYACTVPIHTCNMPKCHATSMQTRTYTCIYVYE